MKFAHGGTLALALVALLAATSVARADNKEVARQSFTEGTRLYDLADFGGALTAFKKAYVNYEEPSFLFNIAQCYRQLGNKTEATRFYRTYLRKLPDAPNGREVRRLIASLEASKAQDKPQPATPPTPEPAPPVATTTPPPPAVAVTPRPPTPVVTPELTTTRAASPPPSKPIYKKWWFWTVTGVAVAAVATGVAVGVTQSQPIETSFQVHAP